MNPTYALQNIGCLVVPAVGAAVAIAVLALRFSQFTKAQLLLLTGAFLVSGLLIAAMVNNLAGAVPCLFPALLFGGLGVMKHSRDLKLAQQGRERAAAARADVSAVMPPAKSSPDSSRLELPDFE